MPDDVNRIEEQKKKASEAQKRCRAKKQFLDEMPNDATKIEQKKQKAKEAKKRYRAEKRLVDKMPDDAKRIEEQKKKASEAQKRCRAKKQLLDEMPDDVNRIEENNKNEREANNTPSEANPSTPLSNQPAFPNIDMDTVNGFRDIMSEYCDYECHKCNKLFFKQGVTVAAKKNRHTTSTVGMQYV